VRHVIVIVAALIVGCAPPADPKHATPPQVRPTNAIAMPTPSPSGSATGSKTAVVLPAVGCPTPTCAFHAGVGGYFTCLAGGAGACFHFGAPCAPQDQCMYDPSDRSYKQCTRPSEGTCLAWGATCAPATKCMFNPADGLSHQCDEVSGGGCKRYGALCAP
jgi:hypothetical protein